jgi:uncharacterized membrane protein
VEEECSLAVLLSGRRRKIIMQNVLVKGLFAIMCLALVVLPLPAQGQKGPDSVAAACSTVAVWTSSPQVTRGYNLGVVALVGNCSSSKQRITVELTSVSACGVETAIGYNRVALNPGQSIQVTVAYPIPADACTGIYTINVVTSSGRATLGSSSTTFTVL